MRDWKQYIKNHLPAEHFRGELMEEILDELAAHLEDAYREALAKGAREEEAEARALEQIEDWDGLAANILRTRRGAAVSRTAQQLDASEAALRKKGGRWAIAANLLQDFRFTARRLRKAPGFTAVALLTLALGIGANSAIFSLVNGILLTPLPFEESDRLVGIWYSFPGLGVSEAGQSAAVHLATVDEGRVFEELGMWDTGTSTITGLDEPEEVPSAWVTGGTFEALRVQPSLGRLFSPEDLTPGTPLTVILSHGYWRRRFGGDPDVLGQALTIDGYPREVIGVMPRGFRIPGYDPAVYTPRRFDQSQLYVGVFGYRGVGRLKPGVTIEEANADVARVLPLAIERFPGGVTIEHLEESRGGPDLRPLKADVVGNVGEVLWVFLGTVGIVLLIACANVANLFLVRAEGREREMAVRRALGADRGRIGWEFLRESLALGFLGGVGGLGLAYAGLRVLGSMASAYLPRLEEISLNTTVFLFTLGISLLAGFLSGFLPALRYGRAGLVGALKEGGRSSTPGRARHRARNALVLAQMALAMVVLVGSGLMIRSYQALRKVDPGFGNPEDVLTVRLEIGSDEVRDPLEAARTHQLIAHRLQEIPGVSSVGLSSSIPMDGVDFADPIFVEGFPVPEGQLASIRSFKWIGEGYFEAMEIPVLAGRVLTEEDAHDLNRVVMVSENFARQYWDRPSEALGKRISGGTGPGDWREIVGVVGNVRDAGMDRSPSSIVYWPLVTASPWAGMPGEAEIYTCRSMAYAIRSIRVGTPEFLQAVRDAIWSVNPNLPLTQVRTLRELQEASMARTSFILIVLGIAASVALILGIVGVYGVISYIMSQRTQELGLRMALGARAGDVMGMVLRQGLVLAGAGLALGLALTFGLTRLLSALLFGVSPQDPLTHCLVAAGLLVLALVASYVPARRAARLDPVVALRAE